MNVQETAKVLAKVQLVDNRIVDDLTLREWHDIIGFLDFGDSIEAVRLHRRESTEYLTPAHVVAGAKAVARLRISRVPLEPMSGGAPRPLNDAALTAAHRSGDRNRIAYERAVYNRQCVDEGFAPVPEWGLV